MTKEGARIVWAAASEYRWRGFDHWWEETKMTTQTKDFKDDPIVNNNGLLDMLRERGYGATKCSWGTEIKREEHRETIEWISISERLPEERQSVLALRKEDPATFGGEAIELVRWVGEGKWRDQENGDVRKDYFTKSLTHWRPLPELPKEGKE